MENGGLFRFYVSSGGLDGMEISEFSQAVRRGTIYTMIEHYFIKKHFTDFINSLDLKKDMDAFFGV